MDAAPAKAKEVAPAAKGHEAPAAKAHDAKATAKEPDAHGTPAAPSGDTARTEKDLEALNERIQRRLAEAVRAQKPAATPGTSSRSRASHTPAAPAATVTPRVPVVWRTDVAWPAELQDVPAPRVSVVWGDAARTTNPEP